MKPLMTSRAEFDWDSFAGAVAAFAQSLTVGSVEAFVIAEHGKLVLDPEDLTLADEEIPADPVERLDAGFDLVAPFAVFRDFCELACADGGVIEVPDLDEEDVDEDDEDAPQLPDKQRKLVEATVCDENHYYGFHIAAGGENLVFQSVLVCESDGECEFEVVEHAGLLEEPMAAFLKSFTRKRSRRAPRT